MSEAPDRLDSTEAVTDFYGERYWDKSSSEYPGTPGVAVRAREDLFGRCVHWLRALLKFRLPPARVLDVGCSHSGFVALMRETGFEATGLEMNPRMVEFARRTFETDVVEGPIEAAGFEEASLDVIVLNDVLEHLPEPERTLRYCARLLRPGGLMFIQTPEFPEGAAAAELDMPEHPFRGQLAAKVHLNLFTRRSIRRLLERTGISNCVFLDAVFAAHDMYLVASASPIGETDPTVRTDWLQSSPTRRLTLGLLDAGEARQQLLGQACEMTSGQEHYVSVMQEQKRRIEALEQQMERMTAALGPVESRPDRELPASIEAKLWFAIEAKLVEHGRLSADLAGHKKRIQALEKNWLVIAAQRLGLTSRG